MRQQRDPLPNFPIADILTELGAEDVPAGSGWVKMHCPFHPDGRMSAAVNHDIGGTGESGFTCHGCDVSGDAVKLLQTQEGLGFKDAVERASLITRVESSPVRRKRRRSSELFDFARAH